MAGLDRWYKISPPPSIQNTASCNTGKVIGKTDPPFQCPASAGNGVVRDACQLQRLN